MIKKLLLTVCISFPFIGISQVTFTNSNSALVNSSLTSGVAIGISDMNSDGLDDIIRLDNARNLQIEYQHSNGIFTRYNHGSIGGSQWGLCIADVDNNGFNDILAGGSYNNLKLITASNDGSTFSSTNLSGPSIFVQNLNFADIDNNGTIDIFACHDDGVSSAYSNDGSGSMTYDLGLINAVSTVVSDNSGNYGTIWIDYDNDGDQDLYISKCRLGVNDPDDGRRLNLLFQNDGNGNYTDVGVASGLVPRGQSWSANFEDIDNDGDLDCFLINHDITSMIYENNGDGTFSDITTTSGIASTLSGIGSGGIQVIMEDFDNDTFVDIFVTARSGSHHLFKNGGDKTFTEMNSPFILPSGPSRIQSAAVGDLNNDGFLDIVAGFATGYNSPSSNPDVLYLNDGNTNNWSEIILRGGPSNFNGIGARIEIHGDWGKQIREVRSGESYGTMNSLMTHFGLASHTTITKIVVKWPSGTVDELLSPLINQTHSIIEGATLSTTGFEVPKFVVYPNPTQGEITISNVKNINKATLNLFNINGKKVNTNTTFNTSEIKFNISHLNSGIYFIHLDYGKKTYIHKIIKY